MKVMDKIEEPELPVSSAIFSFGKSHLTEFLPNQFWVKNDDIIELSCGDEHTVLLTESGRAFVFGNNSNGQLGLGNNSTTNKPTCIKSLKHEKIKLVACGRSHTVFASDLGYLYSCGANPEGQLGNADDKPVDVPTRLECVKQQKYKMLACGSEHSVALTESGEVYVWGSGEDGRLGLGDEAEHNTPTILPFEEEVTCLACGYYHTALVTESGKLFTFGEMDSGKLGLEESIKEALTPQHVSSIPEKVISVSCGGSHTAVVTENGKVYIFGEGADGQLGHGTEDLMLKIPKCVELGSKATSVVCGENFTAIITESGSLYTCGNGRHGRLAQGQDSYFNQFLPQKVTSFQNYFVKKVACGGCHMLVSAKKREENTRDRRFSSNQVLAESGLLNEARIRRRQLHDMTLNKTMSALPEINKTKDNPQEKKFNFTMPHPLTKRKKKREIEEL